MLRETCVLLLGEDSISWRITLNDSHSKQNGGNEHIQQNVRVTERNAPDLLILAGTLAVGKRTSITCHGPDLCSTRVRNWKWTKNVSNLFCTVVPCLYSTLFCMRTDCQYLQLKNKSAPKTGSLFLVTSVTVHNNGYVPNVLFLKTQATCNRERFFLFFLLYILKCHRTDANSHK